MLPGKEIDAFFQGVIKILMKNAVRLMVQNIIVSKALGGCQLVKKLSRIFEAFDIDDFDSRLPDREEEILKGTVQLRAEIPEHDKLFLSSFCELPCGIDDPHSVA